MTQPSARPFAHPFEGLRVLDFCWVVIGPMTTRYFSDFGAEVLRVESSLRPDVIRHGLPFAEGKPGTNRSGYWANYNSGKLGLGLNMGDERARHLAFRLATEWADVVTENFTPGTMERWGLGYDALRQHNPGLVMFSASMLGRGGPYDSQPGFGPVLTALSGHTNFTGWPDRVPVSPYGAYTDFLIPHVAFAAVCAALDHKRRTGHGQYLDLSQLEAALYFAGPPVLDYLANGRIQARNGNHDPDMAPHAVYRCDGNDRWCAVACPTDAEWRALAQAIGRPDLADDPGLATLDGRKQREAELDARHRGVDDRPLARRGDAGVPIRGRSRRRSARPAATSSTTRRKRIAATSCSWTTRRWGATPRTPTASCSPRPRPTTAAPPSSASTPSTSCANSSACPKTSTAPCRTTACSSRTFAKNEVLGETA